MFSVSLVSLIHVLHLLKLNIFKNASLNEQYALIYSNEPHTSIKTTHLSHTGCTLSLARKTMATMWRLCSFPFPYYLILLNKCNMTLPARPLFVNYVTNKINNKPFRTIFNFLAAQFTCVFAISNVWPRAMKATKGLNVCGNKTCRIDRQKDM